MKKQPKHSFIALLLIVVSISAGAQAPSISYSPTTNVFPVGTAITPSIPSNSGGNVPANTYGTVVTFAGNVNGLGGNGNGSLTGSGFTNPSCTTIDYTNNFMYVADAGNNLIRKIDLTANTVSTFAGSGSATEIDGTGPAASFNAPYAISYDGSGALYVADNTGNTIRKIVTSTGAVSTIATGLNSPTGIVYDPVSASLYVSNSGTNTILKMSAMGTYSVYAGSGAAGSANGPGTGASFNLPYGIAVDGLGNLFVADQNNNAIRKISSGGTVTTFATGFNGPRGVDVDISGNLYVSDNGNLIYFVSAGSTVTTIAGNGTAALLNGVGTNTEFNQSRGVCVYKTTGDVYISDCNNNVIRRITGTGYLIAPTLPSGLSFTSSSGKISGTPSSISSQTSYTITAFNSSGSSATTVSIQCAQTNDWTGASSTAWTAAGNWSAGSPPGPNDIVQIGVVAYAKNRQPVITGNTPVTAIVFGPYGSTSSSKFSSPSLTVNNSTLTISWALTANANATAAITGSSSSLVMAPGSVATINGTKLTISTTNFKLQSDATGSASIGPVTTSNFITSGTTVTVERYLPGIRSWVLLSSPVNGGTVTTGSNTTSVYSLNYLLNSTWVSATGFSTSGFYKAGNPSLFLYRENFKGTGYGYAASNYRAVTNLPSTTPPTVTTLDGTFSLPIGNGYQLYFRGGTGTTSPFTNGSTAQPATLAATGTLNQGSVTFTHWSTPSAPGLLYTTTSESASIEGFNLVGNPYACTIDLSTYNSGGISMTNVANFIYELNPNNGNYGVYTLDGSVTPVNYASQYIASGQGFFVHATGTSAALTFNESCKNALQQNTATNLLLSKGPVATAVPQYMRLHLALDSINSDETIIRFNDQAKTSYVFNEDALYMTGNGRLSLASLSSDNRPMVINTRPLATRGDTIKLTINGANGTYSISINAIKGIPQLYDIWLMDAYKKDSVDLRHNSVYHFDVNRADTSTYGANRFRLIIRQNPAYAYHLLDFTATRIGNSMNVETHWTTANEQNYTNFTLERSSDGGATFTAIGGTWGTGAGDYGLMDKSAVIGTNLYRLKSEDINNTVTYSTIVAVVITNKGDGNTDALHVFPNPASSVINLDMQDKNANASYNIIISNSTGFIVKQATSAQANWQANVSNLLPGTYLVRVMNNNTQNLVGESKFIKL